MIFGAFLYGLAVGHFRFFPFSQIMDLRNSVLSVTGLANDEEHLTLTTKATELHDTGLQRLLIKKLHLKQGQDIGRGGAMTSAGYHVIINSNHNSGNKELLLVYNLEQQERITADELKVPMNYSELRESSLAGIEGFDLFRFRVTGMHTEQKEDGTFTLFASHHRFEQDDDCISFNVSKISVGIDENMLTKLSDWDTIFTAEPCLYPRNQVEGLNPFPGHMSAGSMIQYDEDHLLVTVGTFSIGMDQHLLTAAEDDNPFGKIILLHKETGEHSVYASGVRNSQGLLRTADGTIWATDHGPQGGDELNLIKRGYHYGWPYVSYGIQYGNEPWQLSGEQGRHDSYEKPVFVWMEAIAPTSLIEINGSKFSDWQGDLLIASLTGRSLHRVRIEENRAIYNEVIHLGYRIRDIAQLPDERILLLTDEGSLFIVDDGGPVYEKTSWETESRIASLEMFDVLLEQTLTDFDDSAGLITAETLYQSHCASCHYLDPLHDIGPHLVNLFDRNVGGLDDYNYSSSLYESDRVWTGDLLKRFLLNPDQVFPNSRMQEIPLTDAEADSIVFFLKQIN